MKQEAEKEESDIDEKIKDELWCGFFIDVFYVLNLSITHIVLTFSFVH
jgi:hypothetical protein